MTAAETRAPSDAHTAALAAVGRAETLDPRTTQHRRELTAGIQQSMKRQNLHATAPEAVAAVDWYYDNNEMGDPIDGVGFTAALRRLRMQVVRDRDAVEAHAMTGRQAQEWQADKAAILSWPCPEPGCEAGPGQRCVNLATKQPYGERVPGHPKRIVLATRAARRDTA
jgi:hypothetical protein